MQRILVLASASALALGAFPATAQSNADTGATQTTRGQDRLNAILGALFGGNAGNTDSLDAQWAAGRSPLSTQRAQFESRIDGDVRAGALSAATGIRLKTDYTALVQLEQRYGADGRFTTQERNDLADRYGALTQVLADRQYGDTTGNGGSTNGSSESVVANGRTEFGRRVDASVAARHITRTAGTRLKADYASVVAIESNYLRDGVISGTEQDDLDARLDALDARVGDGPAGAAPAALTTRARLDQIGRDLPSSGLSASMQSQLRVELGDLLRLDTAYTRSSASGDDRAYLEQRVTDLESRIGRRR